MEPTQLDPPLVPLTPKTYHRHYFKPVIIPILLILILSFTGLAVYSLTQKNASPLPSTFEECLNDDASSLENTTPPKCIARNGQVFIPGQTVEDNLVQPTPLTINSQNWPTYTHPENLISFRYPPEFDVYQEGGTITVKSPQAKYQDNQDGLWFLLVISIQANQKRRTPQEQVAAIAAEYSTAVPQWNRNKLSKEYYLGRRDRVINSFVPYQTGQIDGIRGDIDGYLKPNVTTLHLEVNDFFQFSLWGGPDNSQAPQPNAVAIYDALLETVRFPLRPASGPCSLIETNSAEVSFLSSYCSGDICRPYSSDPEACNQLDVVTLENGQFKPEPETDGRPDCRYQDNAIPENRCQINY